MSNLRAALNLACMGENLVNIAELDDAEIQEMAGIGIFQALPDSLAIPTVSIDLGALEDQSLPPDGPLTDSDYLRYLAGNSDIFQI